MPNLVADLSCRNLSITTGSGDDNLRVAQTGFGGFSSFVRHDLNVNTGGGDDRLSVSAFSDPGIEALFTIGHDLNIDMGSGNDLFGLRGPLISHDLNVLLGSGQDGADLRFLDVGHDTLIDAGADNDHVAIIDNQFTHGQTTILLGSGDDLLDLFGNVMKKGVIDGGDGRNDTLNTAFPAFPRNGKYQNNTILVLNFEKFTEPKPG